MGSFFGKFMIFGDFGWLKYFVDIKDNDFKKNFVTTSAL